MTNEIITDGNRQARTEGGLRLRGVKKESLPGRPLISIITATFNAAECLPRTIKSIRGQSYDNIEWIIVDGASTDTTVDMIKQNDDVVAYWISERDGGIADAWNKGLALASGEAILILNAGDTYTDNAVTVFAHNYVPDKIICASAQLVSESGIFQGIFPAKPWKLSLGMHVPHNWCLVPRFMYEEFGGYPNLKYSMDFAWFYAFYRRFGSAGFAVLPETLGEYYFGGISDRNYAKGFMCNAEIMINAGKSPVVSTLLCWGYTLKHWLRKKWFCR